MHLIITQRGLCVTVCYYHKQLPVATCASCFLPFAC